MSNILEQMLEASKEQLELEFEHKKELAQIKSCQNNEIKELKEKYKKKISDLEAKLAEKDDELLQKEKKIQDLMLCEFVATTLDFNKLSADNCRLREQLADIEANKEKEINRICKTHIEANAQLKQQLAYQEQKLQFVRKLDDATMLDILQKSNQDKISFAVEKLTEIRDYVKNCWSLDTTEGKVRLDIAKKIRLKIEELAHQHEDKGE